MSGFTLDIKNFVEKAKKNSETVARQVSFKLFSAVILGSPVDTGRFRNNWFASGAIPSPETTNYNAPTGGATIDRVRKELFSNPEWNEFTLTNNLPYAERLEYGWSNQAPQGMVRVNVARFNTLLEEEAAKVR